MTAQPNDYAGKAAKATLGKKKPADDVVPLDIKAAIVRDFNRENAVVMVGNKVAVLRESTDVDGRPSVALLAPDEFYKWHAPDVRYQNDVRYEAAKLWFKHKDRRQFNGIVFAPSAGADLTPPGFYNLWKGFAIQPAEGTLHERFVAHVAENVCSGDEALFKWVMGWFAQIVQYPGGKLGTALVLRGPQGTGKTIVGRTVGELLTPHYQLVADARFVAGRFNAHLVHCLLLQLDEATWGGDHQVAGKLKDLVTGEWQQIEYKGRETMQVKNHIRLLITGNSEWLVPAGLEERRFAVLDVGEAKMQDATYFSAIMRDLNAGGRAHLLRYLLDYDLSDVPLGQIPITAALREQMQRSLSPEQAWWLDILHAGQLPGDTGGQGYTAVQAVVNSYLEHAERRAKSSRRASETVLGDFLKQYAPGITRSRKTPFGSAARRYCYTFPELADCRAAFSKRVSGGIEWPADPDFWQEVVA